MNVSVSCDIMITVMQLSFLTIVNSKTEEFLHSTDASEEEENNTFSSNL